MSRDILYTPAQAERARECKPKMPWRVADICLPSANVGPRGTGGYFRSFARLILRDSLSASVYPWNWDVSPEERNSKTRKLPFRRR